MPVRRAGPGGQAFRSSPDNVMLGADTGARPAWGAPSDCPQPAGAMHRTVASRHVRARVLIRVTRVVAHSSPTGCAIRRACQAPGEQAGDRRAANPRISPVRDEFGEI